MRVWFCDFLWLCANIRNWMLWKVIKWKILSSNKFIVYKWLYNVAATAHKLIFIKYNLLFLMLFLSKHVNICEHTRTCIYVIFEFIILNVRMYVSVTLCLWWLCFYIKMNKQTNWTEKMNWRRNWNATSDIANHMKCWHAIERACINTHKHTHILTVIHNTNIC